ncbi:trans-aconitate 2-methyltransferase [Arthrobacter sp. NtRootA4]|nr:trans-aconitate 2-methyltransferase [Arthrobacter sp. NtRootA2]BCW14805.1 trans-aconitate 2-methyltransferase [Arthrobacter sp. NtRootA4]BCW23140.1 trans-aconitate 2-methyltransferase [Arthrobacter sp. NtRootC7]BCW27407.1 trans-aconitate 2-methyltransferase [Arthrobacter sp. NtRootC45]BCW31674.1 trans-aconitate 2-methyltransferase [Arthrobacter sp. NtRootD5]
MKWNPSKYAEFGNHRDRPFHDLVARIQAAKPGHVVDLGCGPGNMTATLADRWPAAHVVGIDSSQEMLAKAASLTRHYSGLSFNQGDIAEWMPDNDVDVVVTNAALQWVPGHQEMLAAWLEALRPGAWFALQVPGNFSSPSHALMRELAGSPRWRTRLDGVLRHDDAVGSPADYLGTMLDAGCSADAWETTYQQVLTGEDPVLEWVRGTGLRPVLSALPAPEADAFEKEYAAMLRQAYPSTAHGTVFPFRRIFAVARKHA